MRGAFRYTKRVGRPAMGSRGSGGLGLMPWLGANAISDVAETASRRRRGPDAVQTVQAFWLKHSGLETRDKHLSATVAARIGVGRKEQSEGMTAAQRIAAHNTAMECYRRAMIDERTFEGRLGKTLPRRTSSPAPSLRCSKPSTATHM
jgi:hypothetical protein